MIYVIINPMAGEGHPLQMQHQIEQELAARSLEYRSVATEYPGHATLLAREAVRQGADVVVCGGDGTISEVLDGVAGSESTLYIVPCGTGNDFVRSYFGLDRDPMQALRQQLDGEEVRVDCGSINGGERAFMNVSGSGFDVDVLERLQQFRGHGKGVKPYLMALISALRFFKPIQCEVTLDGQNARHSLTILSVANGQYFGGGMRIAREASINDGLFDVILIKKVPRFVIALLLPTLVNGSFIRLPVCELHRCRQVIVRAPGMTVNVDGELYRMDEVRYEMMAGCLRMRKPAGK